jgi:endonuclease YncB( thermonuclease family)
LNNKILLPSFNETKKFNLENIKGNYYVKSVYDGDTITILVPMSISIYNFTTENTINLESINNPTNKINLYEVKIRLFGIDTPEMKPLKTIPNREEHIKKAREAQKFLSDLILNKIITVECLQNEKFGRTLGIIYINNTNINNLMIEKGFANPYDGGKK